MQHTFVTLMPKDDSWRLAAMAFLASDNSDHLSPVGINIKQH